MWYELKCYALKLCCDQPKLVEKTSWFSPVLNASRMSLCLNQASSWGAGGGGGRNDIFVPFLHNQNSQLRDNNHDRTNMPSAIYLK